MTNREFYGKEEEKAYEKEEKEDEKARGGWGYEKWRRDPLSGIVWAGILIWAGIVFLAENIGILANFRFQDSPIEAWSIIFIGAALIVYAEVLIRLAVPSYRQAIGGTLFFATILLGLGLGNIFGWGVIFPLILIALGLSVLLRGLFRGF